MKTVKVFSLCLVLAVLLAVPNGFSKSAEEISILKTYLEAIEGFNFKAAYDCIVAEDTEYKTLEEFINENPVPMLEALRLENKSFYRFKILDEKKATPDNIMVETTVLDLEISYVFLYKMLQERSEKGEKDSVLDKPADILKVFKALLAKEKMEGIPFKTVSNKMSVIEVKKKQYVKLGWKEEILAKRAEEKAQELAQQKQKAEFDARSVVRKARSSGTPIETKNALAKLKELLKLVPDSKFIKDELAQLTKISISYKKVKIEALEITSVPMGNLSKLGIKVTNGSKLILGTFMIKYSLLDAKGKVLKEVDDVNIYSQSSLTHTDVGGLEPGKSVTGEILVSVDESTKKWTKTKISFTRILFEI